MNSSHEISKWITHWGNPASIALMDPACQIFSSAEVPGIIGYRFEANNIIVFGNPLCEPQHINTLTALFHQHFKEKCHNIIYVAATEQFMENSLNNICGAAIGIGRDIILDPTKDPRQEKGSRASLLRRNCKHAIKNNIVVHEYRDQDVSIEKSMIALGKKWVKGREGPQVYLQNVDIFAHREHRRYFYAQCQEKIIGVLVLNRLDAYQGWVISFSMIDKDTPNGTSELLIVSALEILANENCHFLSIGTVPIPKIENIQGLNNVTNWCVKNAYTVALHLFHLKDRERYWQKFAPTTQPTYLLLNKPSLGMRSVVGIMLALNASKK